jgi:HD-GYP domain-containing protein (c-di-GMP phosphodiesterase class II)
MHTGAALLHCGMQKRSVAVSELRFGMFITELDRPWTETPFAFQGFTLINDRQLEALRKLCRHVYVDVTRGAAPGLARAQTPAVDLTIPGFKIKGTSTYAETFGVKKEIRRAAGLYIQTLSVLHDFVRPLAKGSAALDGKAIHDVAKELADSVVRNPDALLLMGTMRETSVAAHARALQVSIYMMMFGRFLQLERDQIHLLGLLGVLQDIGKTRLAAALLEKEELTPEEEEILKKHVELSAHLVGVASGLPPKFASLTLLHHERQDGGGYPRGFKGYQIGLLGSIAAICDAYDALVAMPPYGKGLVSSAAMNGLLQGRGTAFHGPLVEQFIRCLGSFPVGTAVELCAGEIGIVVADNMLQRLKPKVMLLRDQAGAPLSAPKLIDLAADPQKQGGGSYRVRRTLPQGAVKFDPLELFS